MSFQEAVKVCLSKYADFNGRATRAEYWWFFLFVILAGAILSMLARPLAGVFYLGTLLPWLAVAVRRLHDTDRSGWWLLVGFVPVVGTIVLLVFFTQKSAGGVPAQGVGA